MLAEFFILAKILQDTGWNANPGGDMKISNDQLDALLRQQEQAAGAARKQSGKSGGFEAALAEQLGISDGNGAPAAAPLPPGAQAGLISRMLLDNAEENSALNPDEDLLQEAFNQASGTLDLWDSYVNALGKPGAGQSLRDAYSLLQGIGDKVADLKQGTSGVRGQNPGFDSLLNELEIMTTTEKFKFNRGDYNV